ncbi:hypothetical protein H0I76_17060 [Limibaculum sp. M0105]|uniref:Uncharacterized protein n=1 Tax=Thermohalobaculum xanthum TaxID=2753746 RepID=A0A8J7MB06_9RHOB|nr:hypothetical protein [Thermohalobaculum xanthum]MBK0400912.1 hypothetical protein [Thermohalobaculum xanthum]
MLATGLLVLGCAEKPKEVVQKEPEITTRPDCYTVVLFDKHPIVPPVAGVPLEHARFLGQWNRGAWNGEWCHDLRITEVTPDGQVHLVEMHAPYEPWGQPASAFKRTGRIDKDGILTLRYGTESVRYRIENGQLHAQRSGVLGNLVAVLAQEGAAVVQQSATPLPPVRPTSSLASSTTGQSASKVSALQ